MSNLPPVEEAKKIHQNMKIELVQTKAYPNMGVVTKFDISTKQADGTTVKMPLAAKIYKIEEPRTLGYLPTKVFYDITTDQFVLLYYVCDTMPNGARPFGDKPCYLFTYKPQLNDTLEYDPSARVFIDQTIHEGGMTYVVIFGEDQLQNVLTTQWDGKSWADKIVFQSGLIE